MTLLPLLLLLLPSAAASSLRQLAHRRHKRDFMFAAGNSSDAMPSCFQGCNADWRTSFERELAMNASDFYDFPLHPKVLSYAHFLTYCRLADKQTQCFIEKCGDQSADRVFSPANFLCSFKRQHFLRARACLEDSEPISFLRCDQQCHRGEGEASSGAERAEVGRVFSADEMDGYERELDALCTFQHCYATCQQQITAQLCSPGEAILSSELVRTYVQWHSADLLDWHILTGNERLLPQSCAKLARMDTAGKKADKEGGEDQEVLRAIMAA